MKMMAVGLLALSTLLLLISTAKAQASMSAEQKEVWAGEEAYCRYRMANDLDRFMSLWDEKFVGWPSYAPKPVDKSALRDSVAKVMKIVAEGTRYECSVTPLAVTVLGDFANTYGLFRYRMTSKEGKATENTTRITHAWRRTNGRWKIIGAMSAPEGPFLSQN